MRKQDYSFKLKVEGFSHECGLKNPFTKQSGGGNPMYHFYPTFGKMGMCIDGQSLKTGLNFVWEEN